MKKLLVKVCGMREEDNIRAIEALGIDMMGFIFYPKSPRFVEKRPNYLPERCKRVGVFVNDTLEKIERTVDEYGLYYVQLHGNESADFCRQLRKLNIHLIKTFSIEKEKDFERIVDYENLCDYFLFDTKTTSYGGAGKVFDWNLLRCYNGKTPFLLSGGIGTDELPLLKNLNHPLLAGLDLNSKFEISPAVKDEKKVHYFLDTLYS